MLGMMEVEQEYGPGKKLKQRFNTDPSLKLILSSLVGTEERTFSDGLLFPATLAALHTLWWRLDYVHNGVLRKEDFHLVRGIDVIWNDLLDACDTNGDGHISPPEFVAGFVLAALDKEMAVNISPADRVTGLQVMRSVAVMLNEHIVEEIEIVKRKMGWQ